MKIISNNGIVGHLPIKLQWKQRRNNQSINEKGYYSRFIRVVYSIINTNMLPFESSSMLTGTLCRPAPVTL